MISIWTAHCLTTKINYGWIIPYRHEYINRCEVSWFPIVYVYIKHGWCIHVVSGSVVIFGEMSVYSSLRQYISLIWIMTCSYHRLAPNHIIFITSNHKFYCHMIFIYINENLSKHYPVMTRPHEDTEPVLYCLCPVAIYLIDLIRTSQNARVLYPTMLRWEQKCAHFCSEWSIVEYGTGPFWDLWIWSLRPYSKWTHVIYLPTFATVAWLWLIIPVAVAQPWRIWERMAGSIPQARIFCECMVHFVEILFLKYWLSYTPCRACAWQSITTCFCLWQL